jgi:hypothetical protein
VARRWIGGSCPNIACLPSIPHSVERAHTEPGQPPSYNLVPWHRAGFALSAGPGREDEVVGPVKHRPRNLVDQIAPIGSVTVHEDDHSAGRMCLLCSQCARTAVALSRIKNPRAGRVGDSPRPVGATAVGDDGVETIGRGNLADHCADCLRLIEGRNDEAYRLHRIPQF